MNKVMLATDFSERSELALQRALLLARQFDASLSLVHVVDDDQPQRIVDSEHAAASALLAELRSRVRSEDHLPCQTRVVLGDPFVGIARATEQDAPDLLVIGQHRRQALRDVFFGTTAERTIRAVACPVLMVNAAPLSRYGHMLLATDLSECAETAAKTFVALDIARGADVSSLHVYDAPAVHLIMSYTMATENRLAYLEEHRQEASRNLAGFVRSVGLGEIRQEVRQLESSVAEEILAVARVGAADLVVVGTHGRSGLAKVFLGSVAEAVLRMSDRDVLAIPPAAVTPGIAAST